MEREKNFYVRIDLQVEAESGGQILGIVNNFLNNSGNDSIRIKLLGMAMGPQRTPVLPQLADITLNNLPVISSQRETQGVDDVFRKILEAIKSGSGFVVGMDTAVKLTRSLPGLTKENLYYWERKGHIHPDIVQRGAKKARIFSTEDAFKIAYIWKIRQEGFGLPTAAKMAEQELLRIKESKSE